MKLWEVLKKLDENPLKKFECVNMRLERELDTYRFTNVITQERAFYMGVDNDWQEVKQPVTWQEAIEAAMQGRKVEFFLGGFTYNFNKESEICPKHIEAAKWYIEEETK